MILSRIPWCHVLPIPLRNLNEVISACYPLMNLGASFSPPHYVQLPIVKEQFPKYPIPDHPGSPDHRGCIRNATITYMTPPVSHIHYANVPTHCQARLFTRPNRPTPDAFINYLSSTPRHRRFSGAMSCQVKESPFLPHYALPAPVPHPPSSSA